MDINTEIIEFENLPTEALLSEIRKIIKSHEVSNNIDVIAFLSEILNPTRYELPESDPRYISVEKLVRDLEEHLENLKKIGGNLGNDPAYINLIYILSGFSCTTDRTIVENKPLFYETLNKINNVIYEVAKKMTGLE